MTIKEHTFPINSRQYIHSAVDFVAKGGVIQKIAITPVDKPVHFARRHSCWGAVFVTGNFSTSEDSKITVTTKSNNPQQDVIVDEPRPIIPSSLTDIHSRSATPPHTGVPSSQLDAIEARSIESITDPTQRIAAQYFRLLDLSTMPELLAARDPQPPYWQAQAKLVGHAQKVLFARLAARFNRSRPLPTLEVPVLSFLSALQLGLVRTAFSTNGGQTDYESCRLAIASFGVGDLFMEVKSNTQGVANWFSNGGPNSAFVCTLAEFALCAISAGIDREAWSQLLPAACAAAELYACCYGLWESNGKFRKLAWSEYGGWPLVSVSQVTVQQTLERWERRATENQIEPAFERLLGCMFSSIGTTSKILDREHDTGATNPYDASFNDRPIVLIPAGGICGT